MDGFTLTFVAVLVTIWIIGIGWIFRFLWKLQVEEPKSKPVFKPERDGPPSEYADNHKSWYINGVRKSILDDLPEPHVENSDNITQKIVTPEKTEYRKGGKLHRNNGPAIIYADGSKEWWLNGERHRKGGPAIVHADGTERYFIHGAQFPKPE